MKPSTLLQPKLDVKPEDGLGVEAGPWTSFFAPLPNMATGNASPFLFVCFSLVCLFK